MSVELTGGEVGQDTRRAEVLQDPHLLGSFVGVSTSQYSL